MARGLFAGILSGTVVGAVGLGTLSVVTGPVSGPVSEPDAPMVAAGEEITAAPLDAADAAGETPEAPMSAPETDSGAGSDTTPMEAPMEAPAEEAPAEAAAERPAVADATMAEAETPPTVAPPTAPATAPEAAQAITPEAEAPAGEDAPVVAEAPSASATGSPEAPAAPAAPVQPDTDAPVIPESSALPSLQAPSEAVAMAPGEDVAPTLGDSAPSGSTAMQPGAVTPPAAPAQEGAAAAPPAPTEPARIKSDPVTPITDRASNVTTDRLPSISGGADAADEGAGGDTAEVASAPPAGLSLAIERNAVSFDNPEGAPLMAILLRDLPEARGDLGDLGSLPFPVSFVVSADQADVAEAVAFYRGAGAEVLVEVALPEGATPTDAEVTLQAQAAKLTDAVGLLMGLGFQSAGATATQVAEVLSAGGFGLVSVPQGLNTGHKSAVKAGVPAGLVFRELDNDGQSTVVMRRFLDNAAFKARQEAGVIMLGHGRVETVQALIEWSLGNRAKSVALAPISAVLTQ